MEEVLVLKRSDLEGYLPERAIVEGRVAPLLSLSERSGQYMPRDAVERDPSFKQLIPYIFLTSDRSIFIYRRLTGGNEKRLHNLVSIGIGGHVNRVHSDPRVNWHMNVVREIQEELRLDTPYSLHPYGILNEDITEVCRVHLGIVYEARVTDPSGVSINEKEELEGNWMDVSGLSDLYPEMEEWSKILCEKLQGH